MKYKDWQSLHIDAYKSYVRQRYGDNKELAVSNRELDKILEIRDEDMFDNELIKLKQYDTE